MGGEPDSVVEGLGQARPTQGDPVARHMQGRVRRALVDVATEPQKIDRFTVLAVVGSGGMGVVYAAYDPKLDRRVAIKVLHTEARERLLVEARSLARLSHPNVVAVFDVSDLDDERGELYIAMEFIAGRSLRAWLAAAPRRRDEIVAVLVKAGRGLAAAHAAGLIHGDFKPENVLVADDGAVKVVDFGLARREGAEPERLGGTLAYMAPEQGSGDADARSDQYSFAVTVHEALTGSRPEAGRVARGLSGRIVPVLERGLDADPARRHRSMEAMLGELAPRPRSRWWLALAAVPVAGGVVAALALSAPDDGCGASDLRIASILDPEARARIGPRTTRVLDEYGLAWSSQARETCLATRRGEQSSAMLDLRMACLERRLDEFRALTEALTRSGAVADGIDAAFALTPIEPCLDRDRLAGVLPPPLDQEAPVAALRSRLDRARGQQYTIDYRQGLADVEGVVAAARSLHYAPLLGEALLELGVLQNHAHDFERADASLREAIRWSSLGGDDQRLTRAWTIRVFAAAELGRHVEALAYAEAAESIAVRARDPAATQAVIRGYASEVYARRDELGQARAMLEESLALLERVYGTNHPQVGDTLSRLAALCISQSDLQAARRYAERAIEVFEASYGPEHSATAIALAGLAGVAAAEGDLEAALVIQRESLRRLRRRVGDDHASIASAHHNLGDILRRLGRLDEAKVELEEALAIWTRNPGMDESSRIDTLAALARLASNRGDTREGVRLHEEVLARRIALLGPEHHAVADSLNDLGNGALDLGELDRAAAYYLRARDGYARSLGPEHPRVAIAFNNLGFVELERREFAAALAACEQALAIDEQRLGTGHPELAYDLTCCGEARLGLHEPAVEVLERALALHEAGSAPPHELARTRFALARALGPGERARSQALASSARAGFAAAGELSTADLTAVERWLAAQERRPGSRGSP